MRHKYATRAIVLGRTPVGEESISVTLFTESFGLVRARSQGARKKGSKMSSGIQTLSSSDVTLLRGKEGWRMAGAVLDINWSRELSAEARKRAARVFELADRLIRGERIDSELFATISGYLAALVSMKKTNTSCSRYWSSFDYCKYWGLMRGKPLGMHLTSHKKR